MTQRVPHALVLRWLFSVLALFVATACAQGSSNGSAAPGASSATGVAARADGKSAAAPPPAATPGSAATLPRPDTGLQTAILAGGCFWGMEEILRKVPGIVSTEAGYAGGSANATYEDVHTGGTGNAEAVRIVFDPKVLSYEDLLGKWFFRMHDPTTKNRQGNDVGSQYRSAIFATNPAQREAASRVITQVEASGVWPGPIVTEVTDATTFTRAEEYHQRYLEKDPGGYTCHYLRDFSRPQL